MPASEHAYRTIFSVFCGDPKGVRNGHKLRERRGAWASEQAALLRAGKLTAIDVEHIAEEIEDVGRSEKRELANRMAVLLVHLLKWKFQPERRGSSWQRTIKEQ